VDNKSDILQDRPLDKRLLPSAALSIGPIHIQPPVVLGPMAGITDWPMRLACREQGAPLAFTEMIAAPALIRRKAPRDTLEVLKTHPFDRPLGYQLFGPDPKEMGEAAKALAAEADLIDINMGCPVKKVVKGGAGAALMRDLGRAARMVREVRKAVEVPVTVKMRSGWDEDSRNAAELARICQAEGADAITVHARTKAAMFAGEPDLEVIAQVTQSVGIPVIGNGGIDSAEKARTMMESTGCPGVMIARGARGTPWIFREMRRGPDEAAPSLLEKAALIKKHIGWMTECYPERKAVVEMRKHLAWYSKSLPFASSLRKELQGLVSAKQAVELVERYFETNG